MYQNGYNPTGPQHNGNAMAFTSPQAFPAGAQQQMSQQSAPPPQQFYGHPQPQYGGNMGNPNGPVSMMTSGMPQQQGMYVF
jgi:hypothetical protein